MWYLLSLDKDITPAGRDLLETIFLVANVVYSFVPHNAVSIPIHGGLSF